MQSVGLDSAGRRYCKSMSRTGGARRSTWWLTASPRGSQWGGPHGHSQGGQASEEGREEKGMRLREDTKEGEEGISFKASQCNVIIHQSLTWVHHDLQPRWFRSVLKSSYIADHNITDNLNGFCVAGTNIPVAAAGGWSSRPSGGTYASR